ncbi:MAG: hypothetical protein V4792_07995 [Pseudomonadota bacterium]
MLGAILGAISGLGGILGGGAKASSDSRNNQAMLQLAQDRAKTDQYGIAQQGQMALANTDLARKSHEEDARGGRAQQALIGALLGGGLQDVSIDTPGIPKTSISGGLRPSALGESGRAAGSLLNQQALMKMLQGDTYQGGQLLQAPGVQATPKAGWLEKLGGIAGTAGALAGGLGTLGVGAPKIDTGEGMTPELKAYMDSILNNSGNG